MWGLRDEDGGDKDPTQATVEAVMYSSANTVCIGYPLFPVYRALSLHWEPTPHIPNQHFATCLEILLLLRALLQGHWYLPTLSSHIPNETTEYHT